MDVLQRLENQRQTVLLWLRPLSFDVFHNNNRYSNNGSAIYQVTYNNGYDTSHFLLSLIIASIMVILMRNALIFTILEFSLVDSSYCYRSFKCSYVCIFVWRNPNGELFHQLIVFFGSVFCVCGFVYECVNFIEPAYSYDFFNES